jgi:hypothetical protein
MQIPANPTGINKKLLSDTDSNGNSRYRCVEVAPGSLDCCYAVQALMGERFLNNQIPSLPLDGCDAQNCECSYVHLKDRRSEARRVSDNVGNDTSTFYKMHDRHRISTGRRWND